MWKKRKNSGKNQITSKKFIVQVEALNDKWMKMYDSLGITIKRENMCVREREKGEIECRFVSVSKVEKQELSVIEER